jgi:hypothetical protein
MIRTLPLRVDPLPGEALDSWLDAYARRFAIPTSQLMTLLGLNTKWMTPDYVTVLLPDEAAVLAASTGIAPERLHAMTLKTYDGHVVRVNDAVHELVQAVWWSPRRFSRFCPACLAESEGRWPLRWQLAWSFVCTCHRMPLAHDCPCCGRLQRTRVKVRAGADRPGSQCPRCQTDLAAATGQTLAEDHPVLAAQRRIDEVLHAVESGTQAPLLPAASTLFTDLTAMCRWLLRISTAEDFARFSDQAVQARAEHLELVAANIRQALARSTAPTSTALTGAVAAWSLELVDGPEQAAIAQLQALQERAVTHHLRAKPIGVKKLDKLSGPAISRFLRAADPGLTAASRIRYRSPTPQARLPEPGTRHHRTRSVPQMLWPTWTARMMPTTGFRTDVFRAAMSAALLLVGAGDDKTSHTAAALHPHRHAGHLAMALQNLAGGGYDSVLAAVCELAAWLDAHGSPIDYDRRRRLITAPVIDETAWNAINYEAGAHPGADKRLLAAQRHLHQMLTGADLSDPRQPLQVRSPAERSALQFFSESMTTTIRSLLADHAAKHLDSLSIDEPVTWEPPLSICEHLELPGHSPDMLDLEEVHRLFVLENQTVRTVAQTLNVGIEHVRIATELVPRGQQQGRRTKGNGWIKPRQPRQTLTKAYFQTHYIDNGKTFKQIGAETGISRHTVANIAREYGIAIRSPKPQPANIDGTWLREQYIDNTRTFQQIADELGLAPDTVLRAARRHGIPIREPGVHSRASMIQTLGPEYPQDIRNAVNNQLHGWQRLQRFEVAMTHRRMADAAEDLKAHARALARAFKRLEHDVGAQLFIPATAYTPMEPTARGKALLEDLKNPAVRAHFPAPKARQTRKGEL